MIDNFSDLITAAHGLAKEKGWHDKPRTLAEIVCLLHSELSEAFEEYRKGMIETYYEQSQTDFLVSSKPEGFWVEIADFVIRVADYYGSLEMHDLTEDTPGTEITTPLPAVVAGLHFNVSSFSDTCDYAQLDFAVRACLAMAEEAGHDLWETINEKHEYNKTRSYRHGGKVA